MQTICLYYQVHQPFRLRNIPFFEIGNGLDYFDEELNRTILREVTHTTYLPMNRILLKLIQDNKDRFNISFCISGSALDQFEKYMPELIESFKELSDTGCVEFIGDTYAHSLAGLKSREEFTRQVQSHSTKINKLFGAKPKVFQFSEMSYTDALGEILCDLGFKTIILEGPGNPKEDSFVNMVYRNAVIPGLKILMNHQLMGNENTSNIPELHNEGLPKSILPYFDGIDKASEEVQWVNIRLNDWLSQNQDGRINMEGLHHLIEKSLAESIQFKTPSHLEQLDTDDPLFTTSVLFSAGKNYPQEIMNKLGNDMQQEAFYALYELEPLIKSCPDPAIKRDWLYLQSSDHFHYMCTTEISPSRQSPELSPYDSSFFAFINFMNILSDIRMRAETVLEEMAKSKLNPRKPQKKMTTEAA